MINNFFRWKCFNGLKKRGLQEKKEYIDRLEYELGVVEKMTFQPYFLVVQDFIYWARKNDILISPGRGSGAGSLVCYCLWITQIDPIINNLYFERFLNYSRVAPPDLDLDFQDDKRELVIEYVRNKYGHDHVSGISNFGEMKCRGAIRAAGRTLGIEYSVGDKLAKLTPPPLFGVPPKLSKCYETVPELATFHKNTNSPEGKILRLADNIEDRIDKAGQHASGIVIGDKPLHEMVPMIVRKEQLCTEWDMRDVEKIGLIKFDFLGLTTLTVISRALQLIRQRHNTILDLDTIPLNDPKVFSNLQKGDVKGIFQIETSPQMKDLLIKMNVKDINDISILLAVFRPGPLGTSAYKKWLDVRAGNEKPEYIHPSLESILGETQALMIFQEQAMKISIDLAGYTALESDSLRKIIGKKLLDEMPKEKIKFTEGLIKHSGFSNKQAEQLWNDIEGFASYSFNRSHSASYGLLSYQTAFLKTHYLVEYMCALLTCNKDKADQVIQYIVDCVQHGIKVLPPDMNISSIDFSIDQNNNIRFGLSAIKNLGDDIVKSIVAARGNVPFKNIIDFISRVDISKVNKRKLESLVVSGCFDFSGDTRSSMVNIIEKSIEYRKDIKAWESKMATFHKKMEAWNVRNQEIKNAEVGGKKGKKPLSFPNKPEELIRPTLQSLPELSEKELLAHEKELLGFYISGHPVGKYSKLISESDSLTTVEKIKTLGLNGATISLVAIPIEIEERITKASGKKMASMVLEDLTGRINALAFPKTWEIYSSLLNKNEPVLLDCKISLKDINDTITVTELFISDASPLSISQDIVTVNIPIEYNTAAKVNNLIKKYAGDEARININLTVSSTELYLVGTFGVRSVDALLKEINTEERNDN